MVGASLLKVQAYPTGLSPSVIDAHCSSSNALPWIPRKHQKRVIVVKSVSENAKQNQPHPSISDAKPRASLLAVPRTIWRQTLRPLSDFGFGKRSIWEGGVGLFLISGTVLLAWSLVWLRGFQIRSKFRKYLATFEFSQASGICTGTPVRIRGVNVGNVIRVYPSLKSIEAVAEIDDDKIIIPQNSLVEVNQSGLLMETMIDITPRDFPSPSFGPLDVECEKEGLILCDRQKLKGYQGVSLDALVGIFTRLGREAEEIGLSNGYALAKQVAAAIEEAMPLLSKIQAMLEDIQPLLREAQHSGLLKEIENLTESLNQAIDDLRRANSAIMTPGNTELIQKSIYPLMLTLKNVENISSDILRFTGDKAIKNNLKLLVKSLSRLL